MRPVTISIATIPSRTAWIGRVLASLWQQLERGRDRVFVALNHYGARVAPALDAEVRTGAGPASEKFAPIGAALTLPRGERGYLLTCDDDIVYPRDYVRRMIGTLDAWGGRAIVTGHGALYLGRPREMRDHVWQASFPEAAPATWVNCPGTGVMGIDLDMLDDGALLGLMSADAAVKNLDDLSVGIWAQRHEIPIRMVARGREWLAEIEPGHDGLGTTCSPRAAKALESWAPWTLHALQARMMVASEPLASDARVPEAPATAIARVLSEHRVLSLADPQQRNAMADALIRALARPPGA